MLMRGIMWFGFQFFKENSTVDSVHFTISNFPVMSMLKGLDVEVILERNSLFNRWFWFCRTAVVVFCLFSWKFLEPKTASLGSIY